MTLPIPEFHDVIVRLVAAAVLGGLIGLERDIHGRPAGLRTHLLVSLGAALFMIMSLVVAGDRADPGRIAAQIVTGIGFLGAGAIIKSGFSVKGLTTAACLWVCASLGMCVGAGFYHFAISAFVISLISLIALNRLEKCFKCDVYRTLMIEGSIDIATEEIINAIKSKHELRIINFDVENDYNNGCFKLTLFIRLFSKGVPDKIAHDIIKDIEDAGFKLQRIAWKH